MPKASGEGRKRSPEQGHRAQQDLSRGAGGGGGGVEGGKIFFFFFEIGVKRGCVLIRGGMRLGRERDRGTGNRGGGEPFLSWPSLIGPVWL